VDEGGGINWSDNGGGGWPITAAALLTTAAWLESRLKIQIQLK